MSSRARGSGWPYLGGPGWRLWVTTAIVAGAVSTAPMVINRGDWLGWWPATWGSLQTLDTWGAPLAALVGVWVAAQPRRFGFDEWRIASAVGVGHQRLRAAAFSGSATIAGYSVAIGYACAQTWRTAASAQHHWLWLIPLTLIASAAVWAGVGVWLGSVLPLRVALPAGVAVPYGVSIWMALDGLDTPLAGLAVANFKTNIYLVPAPEALGLRALTWVLLAAAVFTLLAAARGWPRRAVMPALSVATTASLWVGLPMVPVPGADTMVCRFEAPVLCMNQPFGPVATPFHAQLAALWPDVPAALRTQYVIASDVEAAWAQRRPLQRYVVVDPVSGNTAPAFVADPTLTVTNLAGVLFDANALCTDKQVYLELVAARTWWLREYGGGDIPKPVEPVPLEYASAAEYMAALDKQVAQLDRLEPADREPWFADLDRRARTSGCRVGP